MDKLYKFQAEDIKRIELDDYATDEFAVAKLGFLSTRPNAHGLEITEEVLRDSAPTVLGKFLVADMTYKVDATTHTDKQTIQGYIPNDQEVEFVEDDDGYLRAYVDVVISKRYAKDFVHMFEENNERAVSVEMTVETAEDDDDKVLAFNICGVTVLGMSVRPSCPESDIVFTRFSEDEAGKFYEQYHKDGISALKEFSNERKMAEMKTYKIDKSKDAMVDTAWGDVDKTELRNKILEAKNTAAIVKAVYLLVESDWRERPSEALKYPVMQLKGDTFVYNRNALASALAYAKQENETTVINKLKKIYKSLELEFDGKEEPEKMSEVKFEAVNIGNLWGKCYEAIQKKNEWDYEIVAIYEEDNQKFAIIRNRDGKMYRWDFSLTEEEGFVGADEIVEVEFVETEKMMKFAEPENVKDYRFAEEEEEEEVDYEAKCAELTADIENRDNIIMERDKKIAEMESELGELRAFKKNIDDMEKAKAVEDVLSEIMGLADTGKVDDMRKEGLACEDITAWANSVKAMAFDATKGKSAKKTENGIMSFAAPIDTKHENNQRKSIWDN